MSNDTMPTVSIIVPHPPNQPLDILNSLVGLDYPHEKIQIITVKGYSPPKQRNEGIRIAKGELLAFVDSHCSVNRTWLKIANRNFGNSDAAIVGGPALALEETSCSNTGACAAKAMASYFGSANMYKRYRAVGHHARKASEDSLILCNLFVRRIILEKEGGFNEKLFPSEENELMVRLADLGYRIVYDPELVVRHPCEKNMSAFSAKIFNYGYGRARQFLSRPSSFRPVYAFPSLFLLFMILSPLLLMVQTSRFYTGILLAAYLFLNGLSSLYIGIRDKKWNCIFFLPILYFTLHLSYGLGFIRGLVWRSRCLPEDGEVTEVKRFILRRGMLSQY